MHLEVPENIHRDSVAEPLSGADTSSVAAFNPGDEKPTILCSKTSQKNDVDSNLIETKIDLTCGFLIPHPVAFLSCNFGGYHPGHMLSFTTGNLFFS